jgi:hypothetical protein
MEMLLIDYGTIIINGLCNSPLFLEDHFKREIKKLNDLGFGNAEIEYKLKAVIGICKGCINKIYDADFERYQNYLKSDKELPKEQRYYYPEPDKNKISLSQVPYPSGRMHDLSNLTRKFTLNDFEQVEVVLEKVLIFQQGDTGTEQNAIELKPSFKPKAVEIIFEIIKDFFSVEQQPELNRVLQTGNDAISKLLFKDNANRLTDTFKKLIEHDFITGCQKKHLENWIVSNFLFLHNGLSKEFKLKVVNKYISAGRNTVCCKSPLIDIKNGQILKVEQPRTKKYEK